MNPYFQKPCSCGGENPTCFKCDGTGLIEKVEQRVPTIFSTRGITKAGETSPEEIQRRAIKQKKPQKILQNNTINLMQSNYSRKISKENTKKKPNIGNSLNSAPKYRCVKCSYKWNSDPNVGCAWCKELGPYEVHYQKLG